MLERFDVDPVPHDDWGLLAEAGVVGVTQYVAASGPRPQLAEKKCYVSFAASPVQNADLVDRLSEMMLGNRLHASCLIEKHVLARRIPQKTVRRGPLNKA